MSMILQLGSTGGNFEWEGGDGSKYTVVGIVKDFVYNNMYSSAAPLLFLPYPSYTNFLTIRLKPNADLAASLAKIRNAIERDNPGYPVDLKFVDEQFDQFFKTETFIGKLAGSFAALAIAISCLGLFMNTGSGSVGGYLLRRDCLPWSSRLSP